MAILAVALFVLVAYTVIVSGDPGPTPGDDTAIDVVEQPPQPAGSTDVAKVVTVLGSAAVAWPLAAGLRGAARRRAGAGPSSASCVAGMADHHRRRPRDQGRGRPAAPGRRRWSTPRAPRSPAATPPTRSSTSGWR